MATPQRDEERAVKVLMSELRDGSDKLAGALFPQGPPGTTHLTRNQELDLIARHWNEPAFRKNLLDRVAPPGPNGYPDPELADEFVRLYREAVLDRGGPVQDVPDKELERGPQPVPPQPIQVPGGSPDAVSITAGDPDPNSGLSPVSQAPGASPEPVNPPAGAPPTADPTGMPAARPEFTLPEMPPPMNPEPGVV